MALADFIDSNMEAILYEWEKFAASTPPGSRMDSEALRDEAERILRLVAEDMRYTETRTQQKAKSQTVAEDAGPECKNIAESHARERRREGFDLNEMVAEYRALRASVIRLWTEEMVSADRDTLYDLIRFNEAIDQTLVEAVARYSDELNRSRELLMGILSHDLRTPLSAITLSADFLIEFGDLTDANAKAATNIRNGARHIEEMVSALLDVTRMRLGGSLPIDPEPADLERACHEVIDEVRAAHPERQIDIGLDGDLRGTWDRARLVQMLSNLVANAVQHGAAGRPVKLTATSVNGEVLLRVHNWGEPIPEGARHRLFEPMVQAESGERKPKGLGIGLYIARTIAEAHRGQIDVESSHEQGTTFAVRLPRNAGHYIMGQTLRRL